MLAGSRSWVQRSAQLYSRSRFAFVITVALFSSLLCVVHLFYVVRTVQCPIQLQASTSTYTPPPSPSLTVHVLRRAAVQRNKGHCCGSAPQLLTETQHSLRHNARGASQVQMRRSSPLYTASASHSALSLGVRNRREGPPALDSCAQSSAASGWLTTLTWVERLRLCPQLACKNS